MMFVTAVLAMTLAGSGGAPTLDSLTAGDDRAWPAPGSPVADAALGVADLGYRLATSAYPQDRNVVLSPLSIAVAFAMVRAGAGGSTAAQLDRVFGFPATGVHDAFNAITRQVVTAQVPPARPADPHDAGPPVVCLGNALFPQHGYPIGQPFLHTLAAQYGAGVHPVDFGDGGRATDLINQWVRQQTAGRIDKVFDQLDPSTRLVLANTVYLRARWDGGPFIENGASDAPFTRLRGGQVRVPTMRAEEDLRHAAADGWQAVEVPYDRGQLAMRILLPAPGRAPAAMLAPRAMAAVAAKLQKRYLALTLPRWNFSADLDLAAALRGLGLTAPFRPDADLAGIAPGLYVQQAVHRANITVDEWGTEAAAVTGLSFPTAARMPPQLRMDVNRPFAFAIVHIATGTPLFVGQVTDPSAH